MKRENERKRLERVWEGKVRKKRDGEEGEGERIERLPWNSGNMTLHWGILLETLRVNPWQSRSILYGAFPAMPGAE